VIRGWRARLAAWNTARRNRANPTACFYCGARFTGGGNLARTVDHRLARSRGGSGRLGNLVFACRACNQRKAARGEAEFLASEWLARRRAEHGGDQGGG